MEMVVLTDVPHALLDSTHHQHPNVPCVPQNAQPAHTQPTELHVPVATRLQFTTQPPNNAFIANFT